MNCSVCGEPMEKKQPNGRAPICSLCSKAKNREKAAQWKENNPEWNREINRRACKKYSERKYTQEPRRVIRPQRGVIVYYVGNAYPDHYTKSCFTRYLQEGLTNCGFVAGDRYILDGQEHRI